VPECLCGYKTCGGEAPLTSGLPTTVASQHLLASLYIDIAWLVCIYMIIINLSGVTRFWSFCFCCLTFLYCHFLNFNSVLYCSVLVSNVLDVTRAYLVVDDCVMDTNLDTV